MEWIGGTRKAVNLIDQLQKNSSLINFYSKEVFDRPQIQELFEISFNDLLSQHDDDFSNHLLIGCFHQSYLNLLTDLFKPCKEYFKQCYRYKYYDTRPCFVIINLKTKSVCLMSIGNRKGHYYEDYFNVSMKDLDKVKENFSLLDHARVINTLRDSLEEIARVMNGISYYEDEVTNEDLEEMEFQQTYLQKIFPAFSLDWIRETFRPF